MSNDDLTAEQPEDSELIKSLRSELRNKNSQLKDVDGRAVKAEKALVFGALGIDHTKGVGRLFNEAYKGELTVDAVKAAAEEYELPLGGTAAPAAETLPVDDSAANRQIDAASSGATPADSEVDPTKAAWAAHQKTFQTTGNPEAASAAHFAAKLETAAKAARRR